MATVIHNADGTISLVLQPDEAASVSVCLDSGSGGFDSMSGLWALSSAIDDVIDTAPGSSLTSNHEIDSDRTGPPPGFFGHNEDYNEELPEFSVQFS